MPTMLGHTYAAFIAGGTPPAEAQKAAEEIAAYDSKFAAIEVKLERIDSRANFMQWQLGLIAAGILAIIIKLYV
jgi:hypothetical protein